MINIIRYGPLMAHVRWSGTKLSLHNLEAKSLKENDYYDLRPMLDIIKVHEKLVQNHTQRLDGQI